MDGGSDTEAGGSDAGQDSDRLHIVRDSGRNGRLRVFYPAECGGLRRPPAAGVFPVVLILHGEGAATIDYELKYLFMPTLRYLE